MSGSDGLVVHELRAEVDAIRNDLRAARNRVNNLLSDYNKLKAHMSELEDAKAKLERAYMILNTGRRGGQVGRTVYKPWPQRRAELEERAARRIVPIPAPEKFPEEEGQ